MSSHKAIGKKIGTICQNLRKTRGLSQEQMAEELGVSKPTIAKLEAGQPLNFKNMVRFMEYFGELERLDKALDRMATRTNAEGKADQDRIRYDAIMAKVKSEYRLNLEEFEFCVGLVPRKEYPVLENTLAAIRQAGMATRYEPDEDSYYGATVGFLKELKRRNDARFSRYRMGENSDFAYKVVV